MAVYKLFPSKDATIYSSLPLSNTGRDPILEVGEYTRNISDLEEARALIKFNQSDIQKVFTDYVGGSAFKAELGIYLATASEIPVECNIVANPIKGDWDNGTGRYGDTPINTTGVCWTYRKKDATASWQTGSFGLGISGSSSTSEAGGGVWYEEVDSRDLSTSQSIEMYSQLDLALDVSSAVELFNSGSIVNEGFIIRLSRSSEFDGVLDSRFKYFGRDTNTIYPPSLNIKWNDVQYSTGSLEVISTSDFNVNVSNMEEEYVEDSIQKFRLDIRPTYPTRVFTTSSVYLTNYALPENSYWAVKDLHSEVEVIAFDEEFTKIGCDNIGPYFNIYMKGLQPERYYEILLKTTVDGTTSIQRVGKYFKVVR